MATDSPFMDGYSSEEYDDVDSQVLNIELIHEYWTTVDGQALLQEPEKAAEEDMIDEFAAELGATCVPEIADLGATFVPEIAASEENVIQASDMAVEEDMIEEVAEELGAPLAASLTPPATPMGSPLEETVSIEKCQELYETVAVIEDGNVVLKGDAIVRNLLRWLLLQTEQCLQAFAREFMRFCRFAGAELHKRMMNQAISRRKRKIVERPH